MGASEPLRLARGDSYGGTAPRGRRGRAWQLGHASAVNRERRDGVDLCHVHIQGAAVGTNATSVPVTPGVELTGVLLNRVSVPLGAMA
jgi:hypothetical protein